MQSTLSPLASQIYTNSFAKHLDAGLSPAEAAEQADMELLQWSSPDVDEDIFLLDEEETLSDWMGEELVAI